MQHTRRDFIHLMALLAAGLPLPTFTACSTSKQITDPYEALQLMLEKVRQSADYLPGRMAEAVASKDPREMFAFVRDCIQTYPNPIPVFIGKGEQQSFRPKNYRWGDAGCLRYGAGTFFEKAHLLKSMLHEAGLEAEVKYGPFDIEKVGWERVFYHEHDLAFDAKFPKAIDATTFLNRPFVQAKLDDADIEQSLKQIMKTLPNDFVFTDPDWQDLTRFMDVVALQYEGKEMILNPNIKNAELGESYLEKVHPSSRKDERRQDLTIRLKLINAFDPYVTETFVEASFPIEKLYGNQIAIAFQSQLPARQQLTLPRNRSQVFTPVIGLMGAKVPDEDKQKYAFQGKSIHINGDTLEVKGEQLYVNDLPVQQGQEHPTLRQQVQSLEMQVWANNFPKVNVRFQATDQSGTMVEGLDGPDFELMEDGIPVPFHLKKQKKEALKVLLLFDYSSSIPEDFRQQGAVVFAHRLITAIQEKQTDTLFRAASFNSQRLVFASGWSPDPLHIQETIQELEISMFAGSALWTAAANASQESDVDLIVFITDGMVGGDYNINPKKKIINRGCPIIMIGVGEEQSKPCLQEMAQLSNGITRSTTNHAEAVDFISNFAEEMQAKPYQLTYYSAYSDTKERNLRLRVKDQSAIAEATFTTPENKVKSPSSWIGIHLELEYNRHKIQRKIAGMPTHSRSEEWNPIHPHYRAETEAALFGNYRLCVEGTTPTTASLLEELIEAQLSQKPLMEAIQHGSAEDTLTALEAGFQSFPEDYFLLQQKFGPNSGKDFFCFQNGIRATLFSSVPNAEGTIVKAVDILPFSQWRTVHAIPEKSFEISLRHSLKLMQLEALNYAKATLNLIPEASLDWFPQNLATDWYRTMEDIDFYSRWKGALDHSLSFGDQVHLLPTDRNQSAFFNLDTNSGTVYAQLMSGAGGGEQETRDRFAALDRALTVFDHVFKSLGVGPAVGAWIALEKKKMEYLMIATIAIITMDGAQAAEELNKTLQKHLCNHFEDAVAGTLGSFGDAYKDLVDFVSVATGKSISVCG